MIIEGFSSAAVPAGIRYKDRLDVGLIFCESPVDAAGVFTNNLVKAAPVLMDMERLQKGRVQAILVNSGIANACTGAAGLRAAKATAALAAAALGIREDLVLTASTGVIGEPLDVGRFEKVMARLSEGLAPGNIEEVAQAMMTTDTVSKFVGRTVDVGGRRVKIMGIAKGAGMIMPDMATMLCFVLTDAAISSAALKTILKNGVDKSFNRITVDGDGSTNDTVLLLANGRAGNEPIVDDDSPGRSVFQDAVDELLKDLALQIVADGEGATKLISIRVAGARDERQATMAARTIANSCLVKTAFFGEDANWGRIIAALGRSGAVFDPERVDIAFDEVMMVRDGLGLGPAAEARAAAVLKGRSFAVNVDLKAGNGSSTMYTSDLSIDYVKINADYRS